MSVEVSALVRDRRRGHGLDISRMTDFSGPWTAADVARLRAEWDRRSLLLIRGTLLSGEEQVGFAARFGPLVPERHLWGYVSNVREDGIVRDGALLFHSDLAFTLRPSWASHCTRSRCPLTGHRPASPTRSVPQPHPRRISGGVCRDARC
jgi:hypothetical protein